MIILGIDPGTRVTGYGIIRKDGRRAVHVENGVISPPSSAPLSDRLSHIFKELKVIISKFRPDVVSIEEVFYATNAKSALVLGHARGVAMLAASEAGVPVCEYSTREIKKAVVGYGNADKNQVAQMVKRLLNLPEPPAEDAADAVAAALCHEQMCKLKSL